MVEKILTEEVINHLAVEATMGVREVLVKFAGNYTKRRNVGFKPVESIVGGFKETKNYYNAVIAGRRPIETVEAIRFD